LKHQEAMRLKVFGSRVKWQSGGKQGSGAMTTVLSLKAYVRGKLGGKPFEDWVQLQDLSAQ